jgi:MFS family permease
LLVFASVQGFMMIAVMSGVVGFLKGALVVNQSLVIAEHCPLDRFAAAYSLFMVINGVITLCLGPLVGKFCCTS